MDYNKDQAQKYIVEILTNKSIKFEVHEFQSGCSVWYKDKFYVIQAEVESIGLSVIADENPAGFDTIPDSRYFVFQEFKSEFLKLIK